MRNRFVFVVCAVLLSAGVALADAPRTGVVTGVVRGPDETPMPGATVQLISTRGSESTISGDDGAFRFGFVIPDTYTVRADLSGFQSTEGQIVVSAGGRADVELVLGEIAGDEILVTGEAPLINKYDVSGGGGAVGAKEIEYIVAPFRSYQTMLQWMPGTTASQEEGMFTRDIEGNTGYRNTFYIDGVDTSFGRFGGTSQIRLPSVSVQQFQLYSSRADAEFSRTTGGISTMTVKSGTNALHGDFAVGLQNESWNAQYEKFPADRRDEIDYGYEAALGGPIVRDQLWFFVSAADQGTASYRVLPDGDQVDSTGTLEPKVFKIDYRPSNTHSLALTGAETPTDFPYFNQAYSADRYSGTYFEQGGEFLTLRWSWAISDDLFLDTALAHQKTNDTRSVLYSHPEDASAPPWSTATNNWPYYDLLTGLIRNGVSIPLGPGTIDYPRDQGNAALSWFVGSHELKLGLDYQNTEWNVASKALPMIFGRGYAPTLAGGFQLPQYIRYYTGPADVGGVTNPSETWGLFARDRWTVGDHWTFNFGLRADDQKHSNDAGQEIFSFTRIAPRVTAVYDVWGDSALLITAGAGRYWDWIPMGVAQGFNTTPQGRGEYDQYAWNPVTRDFDVFQRHVSTSSTIADNTIEPSYKDEFTLGAEWAFHPNWALKVNGLYFESQDQYSTEEQVIDVNGVPTIAIVYENNSDAKVDRTSVTFQLARRFKDNWMLNASYTWSETQGTCFTVGAGNCAFGLGRLRALVNPATGEPWSVENRDGYLYNHLPHVIKVRGAYLIPLGKRHTLNLGGIGYYQSGRSWQLAEVVTPAPGETVIHYLEKAGSRHLDSLWQLDLNASWRFPIFKALQGSVLVEVNNVTDQQGQANVTDAVLLTGNPEAGLNSVVIQAPRAVRALVGVSF